MKRSGTPLSLILIFISLRIKMNLNHWNGRCRDGGGDTVRLAHGCIDLSRLSTLRTRTGGVSEHYAYQSSRGYVYRRKAGGYMLPVFFYWKNLK